MPVVVAPIPWQDSLGGNAKTSIIANISPMSPSAQETLSTLQFVKRAKNIRQKCKVNEATNAGNEILQKEIRRLKLELENAKNRQPVAPESTEENEALKQRLREYVPIPPDVVFRRKNGSLHV